MYHQKAVGKGELIYLKHGSERITIQGLRETKETKGTNQPSKGTFLAGALQFIIGVVKK